MKSFLFWTLLCYISSVSADYLDQQDLMTADKKCVFHYLTPTPKNLWSIEADQNYCQDGAVQGFTAVVIKDALNRTVKTVQGFFHNGYWLSDFTGPIHDFYRSSSDDGVQDFIYQTGEDSDLNLQFYLTARSVQAKDKSYPFFNICPDTPILIVAHDTPADFQQSIFQTALLQRAQDHLLNLCPNTKTFQILGIDTQIPPQIDRAFFSANIDLSTHATNISYRSISDKNTIPKPTELRHEQGEKILSIKAHSPNIPADVKDETISAKVASSTSDSPRTDRQSASDLALIARVTNTDITGTAVVYVDHMNVTTQRAVVTQPYPLLLDHDTSLTAGWYEIRGTFSYNGTDVVVHVTSADLCAKEWCLHEK